MNREPGSGSRALLDKLLDRAGIDSKKVERVCAHRAGHLAAAYAVVSGAADGCMATRSAARAFGLDFIPMHSERYDLILRRATLELPAAKAFLDVLQRRCCGGSSKRWRVMIRRRLGRCLSSRSLT